ncbi:MAG: decarboxylating NADP(+)-dependent phosphogluconate dehydrogenase [Anaerolineae bacterium]|nr:decarboxylating NADP(+)-dependent phosphogluconate dehydrogenase [Anaerolineae bacterium]
MGDYDFGLIGLAVMGQNLVLNIERNGFKVAVFNRTTATKDEFLAGPGAGKHIGGANTIQEFVGMLKRPRKIQIMVKAGPPVDAVIEQLLPYLEPGDLVIDGGNSFFMDSERREKELSAKGIGFLGLGVSGGEEGALWGPSLMPGGKIEAYREVENVLKAIAAKAPKDGAPCVTYLGPGGAGHYVKMVHNGIEYGDMQLIAESYDILHRVLGLSNAELADIFTEWNKGELSSFLIEITAQIFRKQDDQGQPGELVDYVLDKAGQKGTGKWTTQSALDLGAPTHTMTSAVEARIISAYKDERMAASKVLGGPTASGAYKGDKQRFIEEVRQALYCSKICSYAQGMALIQTASKEYNYNIPIGKTASIWRAGCIIRAVFLEDITAAYDADPNLQNLLLAPKFRSTIDSYQSAWRHVVAEAISVGVPAPAFSASLAYYDSYRSPRLPANLIQAQRDLFGAHTFERTDQPGWFHASWE